jgi:hypothetical protein
MIHKMSQPDPLQKDKLPLKTAPSLWKSILLVIAFTFMIVALFGLIVFLFIRGAEGMDLPPTAHVAILIIISGVFAWLVKRMSDTASGMSQRWFPEESDEGNGSVKRKT